MVFGFVFVFVFVKRHSRLTLYHLFPCVLFTPNDTLFTCLQLPPEVSAVVSLTVLLRLSMSSRLVSNLTQSRYVPFTVPIHGLFVMLVSGNKQPFRLHCCCSSKSGPRRFKSIWSGEAVISLIFWSKQAPPLPFCLTFYLLLIVQHWFDRRIPYHHR